MWRKSEMFSHVKLDIPKLEANGKEAINRDFEEKLVTAYINVKKNSKNDTQL